MYKKKGQTSVEFIMLFGAVFAVFVVILAVVVQYSVLQNRNKDYLGLEDLGETIKREVEIATQVRDGYVREFKIPLKIDAKNYTLQVIGRDFALIMGEQEFVCLLPEYTGNISKGANIIRKEGGVVYINV
jgi:hypothetical protein